MIIAIKTIADTIKKLDISGIDKVYYKAEHSKTTNENTVLHILMFVDDCWKDEEWNIAYIDKWKTRRIVDARVENDMLVVLY